MTIQALYPDISPSLSLDFANVKQLDPRVTFARASTARYYDGKTVAKAEENLVLQSQTFNNAVWSKSRATITANTVTAPDGTLTASTLTEDTSASTEHRLIQTISSTITAGVAYTYSIFVKADTRSQILIRTGNSTTDSNGVFFDLSAETASNVGTGATSSSITAVGNGWYRCVLTYSSVGPFFYVGLATGGTTIYTGDGTSGLFVWGAQLEQRSTVTAYTATTTQPITNYIPVLLSAADNEARFDHNPTTSESLGLLIEEQRTNLLLRSEEFDNASWSKDQLTVTPNTVIAPNGTLTGDKLVENTANASRNIRQTGISVSSGSTLSFSVFLKAAERTTALLYVNDNGSTGNRFQANFDLIAGTTTSPTNFGTFTGVTSSITNVGNGWYRCTVSGVATGVTSVQTRIFIQTSAYTGDGFSGIYIWGAQLEAGAFPTSYIPTVASQVTRSADVQSATNLGQLGQGTFYIDATVRSGNTLITSGATTFSATAGTRQKTAVAYNTTDTRKSINGATVTSTAGTQGGSNITIANGATGHINKIALYPQKLTDTNLQALTT